MSDAYGAIWQNFVTDGQIKALPAPGEQAGGSTLHLAYIIPIGNDARIAAVAQDVQASLKFPFVDPLPPQALHVSILGLDVPLSEWQTSSEEVVTASRRALAGFQAFALRFGPVNSFDVAAILEAHDAGQIHALRARLRDGLPAWTGAGRDPFVHDGVDTWLPHLSIAYYNAAHDNRPVVAALTPWRAFAPIEAKASTIQLISVRALAGPERWRWPVEAVFDLS